jgi:heterodisulfide reductase subunit C2
MTLKITDVSHDEEFLSKLDEIGDKSVHKCMQCGTCSGGCPMIDKMELTPRQIMLLSHFGMTSKVSDANTVWLCATCNTCYARCPRGIEIPKVMEMIRQLSLRTNVNRVEPNGIPEEVLKEMPQIALVSCFRKNTS